MPTRIYTLAVDTDDPNLSAAVLDRIIEQAGDLLDHALWAEASSTHPYSFVITGSPAVITSREFFPTTAEEGA